MTGSGSASTDHAAGRFTAEVRAVNHRFLKTTIRAGGALSGADAALEGAIRRRVHRGHVTLNLRFRLSPEAAAATLDEAAFQAGAERLRELATAHGLLEPTVGDVLRLPGVSSESVGADPATLTPPALEAVEHALDEFASAREREGAMLVEEVRRLLERVEAAVTEIEVRAAELPASMQERLRGRIDDLLAGSGIAIDPEALAREVAMLADRTDVREEVARQHAHVEHVRSVLAKGGPVGRRLDFLVQEMHREANTIGSKIADAEVTRVVVDLKADVERLREQVQNLE